MTVDAKFLFGIFGIGITFFAYIPYIRDMVAGRTRPHGFTWCVWGLLTGIAFFVQLAEGAGIGAWVTGLGAIGSFVIFVLAFRYGEREIVVADAVSFVGAGVALMFWVFAKEPLLSVLLIIVIDAFGIFPTVRKSWRRPYEETASTHALTSLKFLLSIIALESYTLMTWLYPAYIVLVTGSLGLMLVIRRRYVAASGTALMTTATASAVAVVQE